MARAKADDKGMKKTEMVRAALGELGAGAKPRAIHDYIQEKFNEDISTSMISNYKSVMKRKGPAAADGNGRRRGRKPGSAAGLRVEHFEQIRQLVRQLGADQVKRLIDVVS